MPLLNAAGWRASLALVLLASTGCVRRSAIDWPATSGARPVAIDRARITRRDGKVLEMEDVVVTRDSVAGYVSFGGGAARLGLPRAEVRSLERETGLGTTGALGVGIVTVALGIVLVLAAIGNNAH